MNAPLWPVSPEDEVALANSRQVFAALADLLHRLDLADVEPLGGFDVTL
jgi:hypothetical protein